MAKKKTETPAEIETPAAKPAPCPIPPGHLERCNKQVADLEYQLKRAKTGHERRHLEWKLKYAKIRADNAKKLQ